MKSQWLSRWQRTLLLVVTATLLAGRCAIPIVWAENAGSQWSLKPIPGLWDALDVKTCNHENTPFMCFEYAYSAWVSEVSNVLENHSHLSFYNPSHHQRYMAYAIKREKMDVIDVITHVEIGLDQAFYTDVTTIENPHDIKVLVNKYRRLPDGFIPYDLMVLPEELSIGWQRLVKSASEAFVALAEAAARAGYEIKAYSGYRSYDLQKSGYERAVASGRAIEDIDRWNARPGHSEHQTGLAVDVNSNDRRLWKPGAVYADLAVWLSEHADQFGFIIRYPQDKEAITGYAHEPWHLRYVGKQAAYLIKKSGLTLDEYIVRTGR